MPASMLRPPLVVPALLSAVAALAAQDPVGPQLAVLNKSGASVSFLDPASGEVRSTVPVGVGPHEAATSPDGRTVVVSNYGQREPGGTLTVIAVGGEPTVLRTIPLRRRAAAADGEEPRDETFHRPHGIRFVGPDTVVVTTETQRRLLLVDLRRGEVLAALPTGAHLSHMVAVTPDGARAFVANIGGGSVSVVDLQARALVGVIETGAGAEGIEVHPTRPEVWVTNRAADTISVVDTGTLAELVELETGRFPIRVAFTPDGARALVSCAEAGSVEVWNVAERRRIAAIAMDAKPIEDGAGERLFAGTFDGSPVPVGILVQPDGRFAYVANTQADVVTVLDLGRLAIARRLVAGPEPDGMTWVPAPVPPSAPASAGEGELPVSGRTRRGPAR
jgi:YVTN family beta-propeller protein